MDQKLEGWFTERSPMWPGQAFSLKVKKILLQKKSAFQNIEIFESVNHGKVLILDGAIQCTEHDECSYQEMITHLPVNCHPNPEKVLVIGGGDGGVLRELTKHPKVLEVTHCEIDKEVIEACKTFIPSMGCGFDNPKVKFLSSDGADFLDTTEDKFDVIITDASDPIVAGDSAEELKNGPAASLFDENYYSKMKKKLKDGGILCCQGENMWLHSEFIAKLVKSCRKIYPRVEYAYTCTPSYPSGQIGFILCSKNEGTDFRNPITKFSNEDVDKLELKYYNADIHKASFTLPTFMRKKLM